MNAYYNENDAFAAAWLRNLIAAGHVAPGDVDTRSIVDVRSSDLIGYDQCHFFAGIGGWSYALRLAGWADDRGAWTGSCPCQPFSQAGAGEGFGDERHLWPDFFRLIRERRPCVVLGEQVASPLGLGWLDAVQVDLEEAAYTFGAVDLCAAGLGAPHIRQRLYWMANAYKQLGGQGRADLGGITQGGDAQPWPGSRRNGGAGGLADSAVLQPEQSTRQRPRPDEAEAGRPSGQSAGRGNAGLLVDRLGARLEGYAGHGDGAPGWSDTDRSIAATSSSGELAHADGRDTGAERQQRGGQQRQQSQDGRIDALADTADGQFPQPVGGPQERDGHGPDRQNVAAGPVNGIWRDADWLLCRDGKWRSVEPGTFPLAHGVSARVGRLRGYGNAIVPQVAQAFIEAVMEVIP